MGTNLVVKRIFLILMLLVSITAAKAQVIQVTDQQLFNTFKQDIVEFEGFWDKFGGGGNCASIALIKSAIGTFGINGVFKNLTVDSVRKIVRVTLRNNEVIDLTFDRLEDGKNHFSITKIGQDIISKQIADYSRLCFAVMCRKEQLLLGYDSKYFYRGVDKLNKGQDASEIYKLLGLTNLVVQDLSIENLKKYKNLLIYNNIHAVYSSLGYYDEFFNGTITGIEPLSDLNKFHCKNDDCEITGAYILN
jgi:hypothetical protein